MGNKEKRNFIQLDGHPSGNKSTRRFSKEGLISIYDSTYPSHFRNPTRSELVSGETICKQSKISKNISRLPRFK